MRPLFLSAVLLALCGSPLLAGDSQFFVKNLQSDDTALRREAAQSLGRFAAEADEVVPALTRALKDEDAYVRRYAAQSLGEIGPKADSAVSALTIAVNDSRPPVGEAAAEALGKLGPAAVNALGKTLGNKKLSGQVRKRAALSLEEMGSKGKSAVPQLVDALKDQEIRVEAAKALGAMGPAAKSAVKPIEEILSGRVRDRTFKQALTVSLRKIKKA